MKLARGKKSNLLYAKLSSIYFIIGFVLWLIYSIGMDAIQINRRGDSAISEQAIENIWYGKGAVSNVFAATQNLIDRGYVFKSQRVLDEMKLEPPLDHDRNFLNFHAHYVLYVIAPLLQFVSSSLALSLVQNFCYFGIVAAALFIIFKETRSKLAPLIFFPVIFFNPNWYGGITGWFFPDRIFIFSGFLLCFLVYQKRPSWVIVLFAIFVSLINERAALIGGIIILYLSVMNFNKDRINLINIIVGVILISDAYVHKTYILSNIYYSGSYLPVSFSGFLARFSINGFAENTIIFIISNSVMLLISLAQPRLALLSILVMFFNIAGTIGGAEKVGWTTHYHSYYFPVLTFSATIGFITLFNNCFDVYSNSWIKRKVIFLGFLSLILTIQFMINLNKGYLPTVHIISQPFRTFLDLLQNRPTGYSVRANIEGAVPEGVLVSTNELGMALLHHRVSVDAFPVSAKQADYLLLPCNNIQIYDNPVNNEAAITSTWLQINGFDTSTIKQLELDLCLISKIVKN